jgi:hypothetical protein
MKFVIDRLKEPSTFRGLAVILGLVGVNLTPDQSNTIAAAVAGVIAAIEIFRVEKK